MSGLICGVDIGSTNLKALLLDGEGRTRWVKIVATPRLNDGLGVVSDAKGIVAALEGLIIEGWREVGGGAPVAVIATTGIGEDGIGVTANLEPLGHAIAWFDRRAAGDAQALSRLHDVERFPAARIDFIATASKWHWLRRERPLELAAARHWITLTDYPAVCWTGRPFISETLAARTGCYDVFAREWIEEFLVGSGAPPLPPVLKAGTVVGTMAGGALVTAGAADRSTLAVVGGHDHLIASSAIRRIEPDARVDSLGTANGTYGEVADPRPGMAWPGLDVSVPVAGGPGVSLFGVVEFAVALREACSDDAAIRAILSEPAIPGQPNAAETDLTSRVRRVLERTALQSREHFEAMARAGVPRGPLFATGGLSRSHALVELRASMFGEAVNVIDEPELTALGAALFAGQGAFGQAPDFARHHKRHIVEPRPDWMRIYEGLGLLS